MKQNIAADLHLEAPRFEMGDDDAARHFAPCRSAAEFRHPHLSPERINLSTFYQSIVISELYHGEPAHAVRCRQQAVAQKMSDLQAIVTNGHSLAVATGFEATGHKTTGLTVKRRKVINTIYMGDDMRSLLGGGQKAPQFGAIPGVAAGSLELP